jgi:hypothetical protein
MTEFKVAVCPSCLATSPEQHRANGCDYESDTWPVHRMILAPGPQRPSPESVGSVGEEGGRPNG